MIVIYLFVAVIFLQTFCTQQLRKIVCLRKVWSQFERHFRVTLLSNDGSDDMWCVSFICSTTNWMHNISISFLSCIHTQTHKRTHTHTHMWAYCMCRLTRISLVDILLQMNDSFGFGTSETFNVSQLTSLEY